MAKEMNGNGHDKRAAFSADLKAHVNGHVNSDDHWERASGFAGIFILKTLRDRGYKVVLYEAGDGLGGTWRWNRYPGAGVDSQVPVYEFSWPEVWKTWNWTTSHPGQQELTAYFDHVDQVFDISKDCRFNTVVTGAEFDVDSGRWMVSTQNGHEARAKYFIPAVGFSAKRFVPDWPGISDFKGVMHHSSFWPENDVVVEGKRCAIIGTGSSGVQLVEAWGPRAGSLVVLQRTPNMALPMRRWALTTEEQEARKVFYPELFRYREQTSIGLHFDWDERLTLSATPKERRRVYEEAWAAGGFHFWAGLFKDNLVSAEANAESYRFWAEKVRERVRDPATRALLAPAEMPHFFGAKRPSVEEEYYEQFNRPSVRLVNVRENPIRRLTETGIELHDGTHLEVDVIAMATGFDTVTGGMTTLNPTSIHKTRLADDWAGGVDTYLGLTVSGYPNMFSLYGAHAPTLLANGPSCAEIQGRWVADMVDKLEVRGAKYVDASREASRRWKAEVKRLNDGMLFPRTRHSNYMGGNAPGKMEEPMCFTGGLPAYTRVIRQALDTMDGFDVVYEQARSEQSGLEIPRLSV
ncbi:hypothetical protein HIM_05241 [Hirsutella minnesotensis 3608]|uniref:FAD/NAD(P)-binding domain-containing protein n=1 Tax=Hirsutella minnesotensis 3608 TaxID=1043627 RepID=A0A0F7ZPD6_9HYPO|nr:hypothetical protein HIM_05241 [Hirsutella minnesotensis 3608]